MVAKVDTIKKKIKSGKKLGFSERARAVNKGLLPSKAKKKGKKKRKRIKAGSGEKMRKPGQKGSPTKKQFELAKRKRRNIKKI